MYTKELKLIYKIKEPNSIHKIMSSHVENNWNFGIIQSLKTKAYCNDGWNLIAL